MPGLVKTSPIEQGSVVDDKFRIEQIIGQGGMGVVVRARHLRLGTPVALKFLLPEALANPTVVERFTREARAAARLTSDHVAKVLDVGSADGAPYMVMEYLDGESLSATLKRRGPLPVEEACGIMCQVCDALSEAHSLGIVHRDLKPANLFLANRPNGKVVVKVLDFGISKIGIGDTSTQVADLTQTTSLLGTPHYMSPEQITSSRSVDARADLWSCGVCLFRMIAGTVPFDSELVPEVMMRILRADIPDVRALRPATPPAVAAIIARCLERDLDRRFRSALDLADALAPYRESAPRVPSAQVALDGPTIDDAHEAAMAATVFPTPLAAQVRTNYVVYPPPPAATRAPVSQTGGGSSRTTGDAPPVEVGGIVTGVGLGLAAIALLVVMFFVVRSRQTHETHAATVLPDPSSSSPPLLVSPPAASALVVAATAPPTAMATTSAAASASASAAARAVAATTAGKPRMTSTSLKKAPPSSDPQPAPPPTSVIPDER